MPDASLIITNSGVPNLVPEPGFIDFGELTLNWADSALYFKDATETIQTISINGPAPIVLDHVPVNEGPWFSNPFFGNPANTAYVIVQKAAGTLPRLKIGSIASGTNAVSVVGTDVTVSVLAGTTTNQIKSLIENDAAANALIYFYNSPGSDGTGIATPGVLAGASFVDANAIAGDRGGYLGARAITEHSDSTFTEWTTVAVAPTKWLPLTGGIVYNRTDGQWERTFIESALLDWETLPDQ